MYIRRCTFQFSIVYVCAYIDIICLCMHTYAHSRLLFLHQMTTPGLSTPNNAICLSGISGTLYACWWPDGAADRTPPCVVLACDPGWANASFGFGNCSIWKETKKQNPGLVTCHLLCLFLCIKCYTILFMACIYMVINSSNCCCCCNPLSPRV